MVSTTAAEMDTEMVFRSAEQTVWKMDKHWVEPTARQTGDSMAVVMVLHSVSSMAFRMELRTAGWWDALKGGTMAEW